MFRRWMKTTGMLAMFTALAIGGVNAQANTDHVPNVMLGDHYDYHYDDEAELFVGSINYQTIQLTPESAAVYPALEAALEKHSDIAAKNAVEAYDTMIDASKEEYFPENGMSYEDTILIRRADDQVLSFVTYHYDYMGGAHGYYSYIGTSFDVQTGEEITIYDVIADHEALRDVIKEKLLARYADSADMFWNLDEALETYENPEPWVMEPDGITIYFNPYEIAPYVAGMQSVFISFEEYPEIFTNAYGAAENGYFKELDTYYPEQIRLADGREVELSISPEWIDYEGVTNDASHSAYNLTIGEEKLHRENYYYHNRMMLVHAENGNSYLYLELVGDNDWRWIDVIDITTGTPVYVDSFDGGFGYSYEDGQSWGYPLTDTSRFRLDTRINLLGTYTGVRYYAVGENGMPQPWDNEYVRASSPMSLVTTRELTGSDPGDPSKSVTISAGERLDIVKTDGATYVDLMREDESMVRLEVEKSEGWTHTINGIEEMDCFEMLYYAG